MLLYRIAADVVVTIHFAYIAFVIFGLLAILVGLALGGLTYDASLLASARPPWVTVVELGLPAAVLLAAAIRHLLRAPEPLIDLRTLRIPTFRVAVTSGALCYMAIAAVPFLLPLLFETVFGWSAIKSGVIVMFVFVGNIGIKPATAYLINHFGFRTVLLAACLTLAASVAAAGLFTGQTPIIVIIVIAAISGTARSVCGTSYNTLNYVDVPEAQMPHANSLAATSQQLSLGLGVAAATVALRLGDLTAHLQRHQNGQETARTHFAPS